MFDRMTRFLSPDGAQGGLLGGGDPTGSQSAPEIPEVIDLEKEGARKVTLKVYGQEVTKPLKDLVPNLQREEAWAARQAKLVAQEEEFQEAVEGWKSLQTGWKKQDPEKFMAGLTALGVPRDKAQAIVFGQSGGQGTSEPVGEPDEETDGASHRGGQDISALVAQQVQATLQQMGISEVVQEYRGHKEKLSKQGKINQVKAALEADPEFGKVFKTANPAKQQALLDLALIDVNRRLPDFPDWGPRAVAAGVTSAKERLRDAGILSDDSSTSHGLGSADLPVSGVYLDDDARALVDKDTDKARSIFSPDYAKSVTARIGKRLFNRDS